MLHHLGAGAWFCMLTPQGTTRDLTATAWIVAVTAFAGFVVAGDGDGYHGCSSSVAGPPCASERGVCEGRHDDSQRAGGTSPARHRPRRGGREGRQGGQRLPRRHQRRTLLG